MARLSLNQLAILLFDAVDHPRDLVEMHRCPVAMATTTLRYSDALVIAPDAVRVTLCFGPFRVPTGVLELVLETTERTSSSEMLRAAAATGSTCTRTANFGAVDQHLGHARKL